MEVLRLDRTTYIPDKNIEGYSSMIWTERYIDSGEFEMKTPLVADTKKNLPIGSLISLRDTKEVMFVESQNIATNDGYPELTLKGRSVDAFAHHRFLEGQWTRKKYKMSRDYTAAEAAAVVLWNIFVNPTTNDVTRLGPGTRSVLESLPNTAISNSTTIPGNRKRRWLEGGEAYPQIITLLRLNTLGVRGIRPPSARDVMSVTTDDKGIISYSKSTLSELHFDIFNGTDRRSSQTVVDPIIFNYKAGHIDDPSYLFAQDDFKTMAYVVSSVGAARVFREGDAEKNFSGWDRKDLWIDGGEPAQDESAVDFLADLPDQGLSGLNEHEKVQLFDGQISSLAPYEYGKEYFLGDMVTLAGDYEFKETMRVSEYVRTEDADGDRGYPGLVVTL